VIALREFCAQAGAFRVQPPRLGALAIERGLDFDAALAL
jgi:hypothetical protein